MQKKLVKYSFIKNDGTITNIEVENNSSSSSYTKNLNSKKNCAYVCENVYEDRIYCFIKYRNGSLYDSFRSDDKGYTNMDWKWKKVSQNVFFTYLKYIGAVDNFKKFKGKKYLLSLAESQLN
jgi:hypothetical protein